MKKIIFYDLETTGRSVYWDQIIQIAAICTDEHLNVLDEINLQNRIDYMNLDVEGYEERVLKGFNIKKYMPYVISVEYLDLKMNKLEFRNNDINNLLNSNLYKFFIQNDYFFVNWLHGDLIFVHKDFRD